MAEQDERREIGLPQQHPRRWCSRLRSMVGPRGSLALALALVLGLSLGCSWAAVLLVIPSQGWHQRFLSLALVSGVPLLVIVVPLVCLLAHYFTRQVRDLEQAVRQRTAELDAARRRLQAEVAEREDLLRAVSHDLNAPLRNIDGMAGSLLSKYGDRFEDDVVRRLERIRKNVQAETELISELLELSRIKTRRQRLEHVETEALVRELAGVFENDLKSRGIELSIDTPLPVLHCERARLRQVFLNLIDNAIKYMGDGLGAPGCKAEPEISNHKSEISNLKSEISDRASGSGGESSATKQIRIGCEVRPSEAEFYVRDTGVGIDAEDADRIFFIFRRGKDAGRGIAGKGVGLATVKSIVETCGGRVWVQSRPGQGSTFRFTIGGQHVPALAGGAHSPHQDSTHVRGPARVTREP